MDIINIFVGLDYHQSGVQVCILDQSGNVLSNRFLANSWKEIQIHVEHYGNCVQAAIESCSGAADIADELIQKAGGSVHLAHPGYVSRMKQGPDKTDYSDARLLADLVRVGYLPKVWLAPVEVREMRLLVRYRQQQVNQRREIKLRMGAILREQRIGSGPARRWSGSRASSTATGSGSRRNPWGGCSASCWPRWASTGRWKRNAATAHPENARWP